MPIDDIGGVVYEEWFNLTGNSHPQYVEWRLCTMWLITMSLVVQANIILYWVHQLIIQSKNNIIL